MIHNMDWDDVFTSLIVVGILLVVSFITVGIFNDHKVVGYYLKTDSLHLTSETCVVSQREWVSDIIGPCFTNVDDAMKAIVILKSAK